MSEQEYLEQRLDEQQKWLSAKSGFNQRWYKRLRVVEIVVAASIPFFASLINSGMPSMSYVVAFLGFVIAAVSAFLSLNKFQENWVEYRAAAETLKREKFLFLTRTPPYADGAAFATLVERVEAVLQKQNAGWTAYMQLPAAPAAPGPAPAGP